MKELAWAVMFMMPWQSMETDKLIIYTFQTQQECAASIPEIKRKHRLFFKTLACIEMEEQS